MRLLLLPAVAAVALAGCLAPAAPTETLEPNAVPPADAPALEPMTHDWSGRITASQLGLLAHNIRTETTAAPIQREGYVFEIVEPPQEFRATLSWPGSPGEMLIMVSSPHVDGKGVEFFTEMSAEGEQCLRIPTEDIVPGKWQIMAHSRGVTDVDFTLSAVTLGGEAAILEGVPHSSAEAAETTDKDAWPCEDEAAA